jgi:hypothetical protein
VETMTLEHFSPELHDQLLSTYNKSSLSLLISNISAKKSTDNLMDAHLDKTCHFPFAAFNIPCVSE